MMLAALVLALTNRGMIDASIRGTEEPLITDREPSSWLDGAILPQCDGGTRADEPR
jgi:hypothetical protein